MTEDAVEKARIARERDLYLRLLELGKVDDVESLLRQALSLAVEIANAQQGYLELHADDGTPRWHLAHGFTAAEVEDIQRAVSRGIIAEAIASGQTVSTPSAFTDPRFEARESVRLAHIEAVRCVPIGSAPARGVLYLSARDRPDFSADAQASIEAFANHLAPFVDRVLSRIRNREASDATAPARAKLRLDGVVGRSPALAHVLDQIALVAPLQVNVLLTGESGTGKSQLARVIHDNSPRGAGPFVELNCAAIPEQLAENELFGALAGAHSTAKQTAKGKLAAAEGGTLFLDEIGELTLAAQAKLLQFLQSSQYYPLGSTKPVRADVRIIAASNSDLEAAVAANTFREDLYYRLVVLPVRVPSLAERRMDIADLAEYFCKAACERHGLPRVEMSPNTLCAAESAEWPGNVRQLAHAVEAAVIRAAGTGAEQVEVPHLFPASEPSSVEAESGRTFQEATRKFQADFLRRALEENDWNVAETARQLDVARSHIYNLIRVFGLQRDPSGAS